MSDSLQFVGARFSIYEVPVLAVNILLLIFAKPICKALAHGDWGSSRTKPRLHIFRVINILIVVLVLFYKLYLPIAGPSILTQLIGALLVIYCAYLGFHVLEYFVNARFGKHREVDGKNMVSESYN